MPGAAPTPSDRPPKGFVCAILVKSDSTALPLPDPVMEVLQSLPLLGVFSLSPLPQKSMVEVAAALPVTAAALLAVLPGTKAVRPSTAVLPWLKGVLPAVTEVVKLAWSGVVRLRLLGADL